MGHGIADEAHAAQHQEHPDRARAERESERAGERPAHELEFRERRDQEIEHQAAGSTHSAARSSNASHIRRATKRFSGVRTTGVLPQATGSRASSKVSGK